jgi:monovalent cation/hydrogen antiporter
MAGQALEALSGERGPFADHWRLSLQALRSSASGGAVGLSEKRRLGLASLARQRAVLEALRSGQRVGPDAFAILQEELDFSEVALRSECDRMIEEG